jgi:hypothetical protein
MQSKTPSKKGKLAAIRLLFVTLVAALKIRWAAAEQQVLSVAFSSPTFKAFYANRQGAMKLRKIMDVLLIVMILPVFTTMLTGIASTGNETTDAMITAITGILPIFLLIDAFSGMTGGK